MARRRISHLICALLVTTIPFLGACSSSLFDPDPSWYGYTEGPNSGIGWIGFTYPFGPYETTDNSVAMGGTTFIPITAACPGGLGPGYTITWFNDATGESGPALFGLNCLVFVYAWWEAPAGMITLDPGENHITVTSSDGLGNIGRATITINRN